MNTEEILRSNLTDEQYEAVIDKSRNISQRSADMVSSKADGNSRAARSKPGRHRRKR